MTVNFFICFNKYKKNTLPVVVGIAGLPPNFSKKCVAQLILPSPLWPPPLPPLDRSSWIDN